MNTLHRQAVLQLPLPPALSTAPATPAEEAANAALMAYLQVHCPEVDAALAAKQKAAVSALHALFAAWCGAPFHMFVSGSYRIGVHSADADIDVLFVTTEATTRSAVFTGFLAALAAAPGISDLQPIPNARVPLIGAKLDGQEFDILTCHLRVGTLPPRDELLRSYEWMNGLEDACILGFNGPRLTELILLSVPRPTQFRVALRFLRHWAKARLVYSNKAGFLGGVNFALMLMYVAQRYPKAPAAVLVARFFATFAAWKWARGKPRPLRLDEHVTHECPVWLAAYEWAPRAAESMVVLTPCFPRFNTTFTTSPLTLAILQREFQRAAAAGAAAASYDAAALAALCGPVEALRTCPRFIRISIAAPTSPEGRSWQGYVEAQCRYLVEYMSREELAIAEFRYVPAWHTTTNAVTGMCTKSTYVTAADDGKIRTFLVRGSLEQPLTYFIRQHASAGPPRPTFSTITAQFCGRDALPADFCQKGDTVADGILDSTPSPAIAVDTAPGRKRARAPPFAPPPPRRAPPPPAPTMHWQLADGRCSSSAAGLDAPVTPAAAIVRPLLRDGAPIRPYDVYIGRAWPHRRLAASPFAPPTGGQAYAAYAAARMRTDRGWARAVRALRGKVLACWCGGGAHCHGHVLRALANARA